MSNYTIISMYTVNTPYEEEVKFLEESVARFRIPYRAYPIESTRSWVKNTQKKAVVIQSALEELQGNIVWLDADAVVLERPVLFETLDCDFAAVFRKAKSVQFRLLSGTMFLRNNEKVRRLVERWLELNEGNHSWDQENLYHAIKEFPELDVFKLPGEYTRMRPKNHQGAPNDGVIYHNQRSRKIRSGEWSV